MRPSPAKLAAANERQSRLTDNMRNQYAIRLEELNRKIREHRVNFMNKNTNLFAENK